MTMVPITASTKTVILDTGGALSGIAISTANRTNTQSVPNMTGLLFFGIPLPSL